MGSIAKVQLFSQLGLRILIDSLHHMGLAVNQEYLRILIECFDESSNICASDIHCGKTNGSFKCSCGTSVQPRRQGILSRAAIKLNQLGAGHVIC